MELTNDDRAAMVAVLSDVPGGVPGSSRLPDADDIRPLDEAIYLAGLRAGIERAAKACDELQPEFEDLRWHHGVDDAAAAIRRLLD